MTDRDEVSTRRAAEIPEGRITLAEGFAMDRERISALFGTPNQTVSVRALFEKRSPVFER